MTGDGARTTGLVGRGHELRLIAEALGRISELGRTLCFVGDPGVGKSALLDAAVTEAHRRGLMVLSVRGSESERHLRFAALHRLLRPVLDRAYGLLPPTHRVALLSAFGLTRVEATPDRFFIALAVLELIADIGAEIPLVLAVDDLHWVDGASRDAIEFVARRITAEPAVIVMTSRPPSPSLPSGEQGVTSIRLEGLGANDSRELLQTHSPRLSTAEERRVLAAAAGNPLALIELPLVLGPAARANRHLGEASLPLTARLERSFATRAQELDPAARTLLLVAALQDGDRLIETRAAFTELTGRRGATEAGVESAVAAGLLSLDGESFRFHHPLVRSAIAQSAGPDRRRAVHEAFARSLSGDPDRATWHRALCATAPDEALAVALDAGADRAVARGAPDLAQHWLARAAQLSVDDRRRGHRLLRAAELAFELGQGELVEQLMGEARLLALDPPDHARLAGLEGAFDEGVPGYEDNVRRLVQAAHRARAGGEAGLAADLLLGAAMPCYWGAAKEPLRGRVRAAVQVLGLPGDDPRVMVLNALIDPFDRGADLVGKLDRWVQKDTWDPTLASALGRAGFVIGDFDRGLLFARRASEGLRRQGRVALLAQALVLQTFAALYLGRWDVTHVASDEAYRLAVETRQPVWAAFAQLGQAGLAGLRGEYARAQALAAEVERTALVAGNGALLNGVQLTRGLAALGSQRPQEAFTELCRMMDRDDQAYQSPQCAWAVDYLAEAAVLTGRSDHALAVLKELDRLTGCTTAPGVVRAMRLSRAILVEGDDAEPRFEEAREMAAAPLWYRARLDLGYGSWLRRRRRIVESRAPLRSAQVAFDALGAPAWSARAGRELAAAGQHIRRRAPDGWARLSAQELQIAHLAAEGLSNREIGARLYLSHRTVASHLYRLFPKLGVHSRAQLHMVLAES